MVAVMSWMVAMNSCGGGAELNCRPTATGVVSSPKSTPGTPAASGTSTASSAAVGSTATTPTTATGFSTPTGVELCGDGVDNDLDGLLNCADEGCQGHAACEESICDEALDNDSDGLFDCEDEDCWSSGFAVALASVTHTGNAFTIGSGRNLYYYGSTSGCSGTALIQGFANVGVKSPAGELRVIDAAASQWTTCTWTADSSYITNLDTRGGLWTMRPGELHDVHRPGFALSSGCPVQTSAAAFPSQLEFGAASWPGDTEMADPARSGVWLHHNKANPVPINSGSGNFDEWLSNPSAARSPAAWYYHRTSYLYDPGSGGGELLTVLP